MLTLFSFLFFLSLQRSLAGILANRRQVEWNTPFIRIFYSRFDSVLSSVFCLLLCFPSMWHTFFLALGSISIFLSRAEWLLRVEHFIENFKFQSQECCSDCFIGGGKKVQKVPKSKLEFAICLQLFIYHLHWICASLIAQSVIHWIYVYSWPLNNTSLNSPSPPILGSSINTIPPHDLWLAECN